MSFRNGLGFVSLFFINPLIILLLFQNFTIAKDTSPVNSARNTSPLSLRDHSRGPASIPDGFQLLPIEQSHLWATPAPKRCESGLE